MTSCSGQPGFPLPGAQGAPGGGGNQQQINQNVILPQGGNNNGQQQINQNVIMPQG